MIRSRLTLIENITSVQSIGRRLLTQKFEQYSACFDLAVSPSFQKEAGTRCSAVEFRGTERSENVKEREKRREREKERETSVTGTAREKEKEGLEGEKRAMGGVVGGVWW